MVWEIPVPDTPAPFLVGTENGFIVAVPGGAIRAYGLDGGSPLWTARLSASISAPPLSAGNRLAVPLSNETIEVLDAGTGETVASVPTVSIRPLLSLVPRGIAAADPEGAVILLRLDLDAVLWTSFLPEEPSTAAAWCDGRLLVGTASGLIVALDPEDGKTLWTKDLRAGAITTSAACGGRLAFIGAADNRLHLIKLRRRKGFHEKWAYLTGGDIVGRPLLSGAQVMFLSYDTYLYTLRARNGHLIWKVRLGQRPRVRYSLLGDLLLLAPLNAQRLELFKLPAGTQPPAFALGAGHGRFVTAPTRAGDMVVIGAARYGDNSARVIGLARVAAEGPGTPSGSSRP
ncbi:MAG: PQQ-binding-like beta-propeller repeat protein [Acidobacteriota bacterium]